MKRTHEEKASVLDNALRLLNIELHELIIDKVIKITDLINTGNEITIIDILKLKNENENGTGRSTT